MPETADLRRLLRESQESRKRAWHALQGIRAVLRAADVCELAPPSRPPCFEAEGVALKRGLAETAYRLLLDLEELQKAIEAIRPSIGTTERPAIFSNLLISLNRALVKARVSSSALEQFRK